MRRAFLIGSPALDLDVRLGLARMHELLGGHLGFGSVSIVTDAHATRSGIMSALEAWISAATPTDDCLIYYFGHGGQLRFCDGPAAGHRFGLLATMPESRGELYGSILDIELSVALARLDRRCGNVTALFDCCHSGELARTGKSRQIVRDEPTPDWALPVLTDAQARGLAIESHPRIARLTGASPMREAFTFAEERGGERVGQSLGHLTRAFVDTVLAAGPRWSQLSWEVIAHSVRERVIAALGMESQWVNFAGPRTRRLFSREQTEARRVIGFVPSRDPKQGWLRAGACSGVKVGDHWHIHAHDPSEQIDAEVVEVELNRSTVAFAAGNASIGCCAELSSASTPEARAARWLDAISAIENDEDVPLQWSWGRVGPDGQLHELPLAGSVLEPDDRIWIRIDHLGMPPLPWFASAVLIDTNGLAHLLNTRAPDGVELIPGEHQLLGIRYGLARQGYPLPGPPKQLLLLACRRPIELGHLVELHPDDFEEALALQGMSPETDIDHRSLGSAPVLATGWWAHRIELSISSRAAAASQQNFP